MYVLYMFICIYLCVCSLHTVCLHMFLQNYLYVPFHWPLAAKKRIDFFWYIQSEIIIWTNIMAIGHGDLICGGEN